MDSRFWVKDNADKLWHFYGSGHFAYSACGRPSVPGTPLVDKDIPEHHVCKECAKQWGLWPLAIKTAYEVINY